MNKKTQSLSAISIFLEISKVLENSNNEILRLYSPDMAKIPYNNKKNWLKLDTPEKKQQLENNVQVLSSFLKTKPLETLLFVALYSVESIKNNLVSVFDITQFINISGVNFLPVRGYLTVLKQKGLIRPVETFPGNDGYRVTNAAERALLDNKPFKVKKTQKTDRYKFCHIISSLIEKRNQEDIDTEELFKRVLGEERANTHLKFIKEIQKLLSNVQDRTLFYEICNDFVEGGTWHTLVDRTLSDIYDNKRDHFNVARSIMGKSHILQTTGLAELLAAKFLSEAEITLTEKGMHLFLEEDFDLFNSNGNSDRRLITPDKIPARKLFFSEELTSKLNFVKNSLEESSFVELQKRLEENSLPKGVAMLFHGLPGTGKTAAVDMLAKATGRSVYHVDIADSKTCWFGESEKLFKKIFTDYRYMCEREKRKPILLFNEADALFSKRRDVDSGNTAQTENALQNILLEEMETLDGILIATTNLCENFDAAFERRFLFKVKFGQPSTEAKKAIWKSKLSWLSDEECDKLATRYDLSGGEIDNIVRKTFMEQVTSGVRPSLETIEDWCRNEKLGTKNGNAIGFAC